MCVCVCVCVCVMSCACHTLECVHYYVYTYAGTEKNHTVEKDKDSNKQSFKKTMQPMLTIYISFMFITVSSLDFRCKEQLVKFEVI